MTIEEIVIFMIKDVMYLTKIYRMVTVLLLLGINPKMLKG